LKDKYLRALTSQSFNDHIYRHPLAYVVILYGSTELNVLQNIQHVSGSASTAIKSRRKVFHECSMKCNRDFQGALEAIGNCMVDCTKDFRDEESRSTPVSGATRKRCHCICLPLIWMPDTYATCMASCSSDKGVPGNPMIQPRDVAECVKKCSVHFPSSTTLVRLCVEKCKKGYNAEWEESFAAVRQASNLKECIEKFGYSNDCLYKCSDSEGRNLENMPDFETSSSAVKECVKKCSIYVPWNMAMHYTCMDNCNNMEARVAVPAFVFRDQGSSCTEQCGHLTLTNFPSQMVCMVKCAFSRNFEDTPQKLDLFRDSFAAADCQSLQHDALELQDKLISMRAAIPEATTFPVQLIDQGMFFTCHAI
jgi:hypothetical protein